MRAKIYPAGGTSDVKLVHLHPYNNTLQRERNLGSFRDMRDSWKKLASERTQSCIFVSVFVPFGIEVIWSVHYSQALPTASTYDEAEQNIQHNVLSTTQQHGHKKPPLLPDEWRSGSDK